MAGKQVMLNKLVWDWSDPLTPLYDATTDGEGHFVFDKLPAGEFQICLATRGWQTVGQPTVKALEASVTVSAGETKTIQLGSTGRTVLARLHADLSIEAPDWTEVVPVLSRDIFVPPAPARSDYVSNAAHEAARFRYAHDPAVRAAMRQQRTYVGEVAADGTATFENIPPGRYVLEVKIYTRPPVIPRGAAMHEREVTAQLRADVSVPEAADSNADDVISLGDFKLERL